MRSTKCFDSRVDLVAEGMFNVSLEFPMRGSGVMEVVDEEQVSW